ncbi:MAG: hypothetical protein KF723_22760 [Rhizobiaceae bacterium]|nr:hypothetical protein [Rhizobiaceae bacterium]
MHNVVKACGVFLVAFGIIGIVLVFEAYRYIGVAAIPVYAPAIGLVVAGALLYCFGAIVEHLIAIRASSASQVALLEAMSGRQAPPDMSLWSSANRSRYISEQG